MKHTIETVDSDVFVGKKIFDGEKIFKNGLPIFLNKAIKQRPPDLQVHTHDFIEISYVFSGKGTHQILDESIDISKGDLFLINPGIPHRFMSAPEYADDEFVIYNFDFSADLISEANIQINKNIPLDEIFIYSAFLNKDNSVPYYHAYLQGNKAKEVEYIFDKAYREFSSHRVGYENVLFSYLTILLVLIFRIFADENDISDSNNYKKDLIENALQYINENFTNPSISLETIANQYFLNKNYFAHLFKDEVGCKYTKYIQNKRISYACELLTTTNQKVIDIMYQCGYRDIKYFNELFQQITGKTPTAFRKHSEQKPL